ncbi:MAG: adenylate/guanylate cyclase domain-containing protein [Kineosporiaceae bacterium]|nr:adenylate/guanylate cyclase domain-containing protein [Aeromicrobium sp.]
MLASVIDTSPDEELSLELLDEIVPIGELAAMVDRFEEVATGLITDHHGQVIKTIGDEVLFVTDQPKDASLLALELLEEHLNDDMFPEVRVGMAYGNVLSRLVDVFGPVVNVASRLTSVAKPGRAGIARALADGLRGGEGLRIRRMRRTAVKGYDHLEPWSLKRPREIGDPRPTPRAAFVKAVEDAPAQVDDATRVARAALGSAIERPLREKSPKLDR